MSRNFTIYGAVIMLTFMGAAFRGYAFESLFMNKHHAGASENHYHK
jgi:hypothetical protein